jgi:hypothetical protein
LLIRNIHRVIGMIHHIIRTLIGKKIISLLTRAKRRQDAAAFASVEVPVHKLQYWYW